jgi:hypothetical protein
MARGLTGERLGAELRRLRCRAVAAALTAPQEASCPQRRRTAVHGARVP